MKSRRGFAIQRLMNAMRQAHADGWFIVFDTLTLRSEERFSRNAETDLVCRLLLEKKNEKFTDFVLPSVPAADRTDLVVKHGHVRPQKTYNLLQLYEQR